MVRGSASGSVVECPGCGQPNLGGASRCMQCDAALRKDEPPLSDTLSLLFRRGGRIGRSTFWPAMSALSVAMVVFGSFFRGLIPAVILLLVVYAVVASMVKRLHDRDRSGHWLWLFVFLPLFAPLGVSVLLTSLQPPALLSKLANVAVGLLAVVFLAWGVVELGFLPGTEGANRFGPDPRAGSQGGKEREAS